MAAPAAPDRSEHLSRPGQHLAATAVGSQPFRATGAGRKRSMGAFEESGILNESKSGYLGLCSVRCDSWR
jgi:hypothetical protein